MRWCSLVITILTQTVSNAFEKSASTMSYLSPLHGAQQLVLMFKRTVEVEYPLQKLEMVSPRRDFLAQKPAIWEAASFW